MGSWWRGTALVAERGLLENLRSRSFKVLTGLLLLVSIAAVTLPQILGGGSTTYTIATIGEAAPKMVEALNAAAKSAHFTVKNVSRTDAAPSAELFVTVRSPLALPAGRFIPRPARLGPSLSWSPRPWSHSRPRAL